MPPPTDPIVIERYRASAERVRVTGVFDLTIPLSGHAETTIPPADLAGEIEAALTGVLARHAAATRTSP